MMRAWLLSTSHAFTREWMSGWIGLEFIGFGINFLERSVVMVVHYLVLLAIDLLWSEQKQLTFHNNACFVLFLFLFLVYMFHISLFSLRLAHFSYGFLCSLFSSRSRSRLHSLKDMWKHYCYDWSLFRICHNVLVNTNGAYTCG